MTKHINSKGSAFIITKPLQFLNCTNIEDSNTKVCMLCKHFADVDLFFSTIKNHSIFFNCFLLFNSKILALLYVIFHQNRYNKLYIDSDYGLNIRFLLLFLYSIEVYTFEEGYASYTYLRKPNSPYNKILLKITTFFKIKNWSGGSCKVLGVYLYDHDYFKKNITLKSYHFLKTFKEPFYKHIINSSFLEYSSKQIDFSQFKNKKLVIYLSYWDFYPEINTLLEKYPDHYKILKAHPNIVDVPNHITEIFDYTIPTNLLFEYFLFKVIDISKSTHIIHHGSFALHYLNNFKTNKVTQEVIEYSVKECSIL